MLLKGVVMFSRFLKNPAVFSQVIHPIRRVPTLCFFSTPVIVTAPSPAQQLINRIFNELPQDMHHELKKVIVQNHCKRAEDYSKKDSRFARIIAEIPATWTPQKKLDHVAQLLETYYAKPVITAHPTRVLSNETIYRIDGIVATLMNWSSHKRSAPEAHVLEQTIRTDVYHLCQQSLLPSENLTPQQEVEFANYCLRNMLNGYPQFLNRVVNLFAQQHGGETEAIKHQLKSSVKRSFKEIGSWVPADFDGAPRKTAQTMERMVHVSQSAIIDLYLSRLEPLRHTSPKLQGSYDYLVRCKQAMALDISFNVKRGNTAQKRFINLLDQAIKSATDEDHQIKLIELRDLVEMAGFWGGLQEFVRQSSTVNTAVFDHFFQILAERHIEINTRMQKDDGSVRIYSVLDESEQATLLQLLGLEPRYFATIKQHAAQFPPEVVRELERLNWVLRHQDIFRSYITSDTVNIVSLKEVVVLFAFASYMKDALHIGDINHSPVNLLPLCETPKDLAHLGSIIKAIFEDSHLRELMVSEGKLSFVAGPSDLGKVGGVFTLVQLILACKQADEILQEYKIKHPELASVELSILYGLGGDSKRRVSKAQRQLHSTFQGSDAHALAAYGAYVAYLEDVVGGPSENTLRAQEFRWLEKHHPADFANLQQIVKIAVDGYQVFAQREDTKALFTSLTVSELGPRMNISSRGEAKSNAWVDITKSRAIGLVNYQLLTLVLWDTFMSAAPLVHLDPSLRAKLPFLFQKSTVIQEIVYKIIYSIAVSDIPRAWTFLHGSVPSVTQRGHWAAEYLDPAIRVKQLHHTLAHIDANAYSILETMVEFLPDALQQQARTYLHANPFTSKPSHQVAVGLLETLGTIDNSFKKLAIEIRYDLLPRYKRLARCIDEYRANPTPSTAEHVVLACRGDERITAGPTAIADMRSWLMKLIDIHEPAPDQEQNNLSLGPNVS